MLAHFTTRSVRFKATVAGDSFNKVKPKLPILFTHIHIHAYTYIQTYIGVHTYIGVAYIHTYIHRVDVVNIVFAIYKELGMDVFVSNKKC